ncbi:methyltransferase domain-containing protein [Candidatus Woesearchaeota archaeon]|nr:methyltransferase domain-containing protein [Candidatus Woesearchaeota archaeon]
MIGSKQQAILRAYEFYAKAPFLYDALHRYSPLRNRAVGLLGLRPGSWVLDLGCGTGLSFPPLQEKIGPSGLIVGIDFSPAMISKAASRVGKARWKNVELHRANGESVKLKKNSFDAVLAFISLSAMDNWKKALKNGMDALKRGGRAVIVDGKPSPSNLLNFMLPLLRWKDSWYGERDLFKEIQMSYNGRIIEKREFSLGTQFLAVLKK